MVVDILGVKGTTGKSSEYPMQMTLEERRIRLKEWLDCICGSVTEAVINQHIFWEVQDIIRSNPQLQNTSSAFYDYMGSTFIHSTSLAVRRQLDTDKSCISMHRFLLELKDVPELISRTYLRALYNRPDYSADFADSQANHSYNTYVGENATVLEVNAIQQEIDSLKVASDNLRHYADRVVAHYDKRGLERSTPKFNGLTACLAVLEKLVLRYKLLLKGAAQDSLLPTFQYDWKHVFRFPWIPGE